MNPGELVAGRFEIDKLAGQGGMSTVYRAIDRADGAGRPVAIKLLHAGRSDEDRFVREAEILALLDHPAFVRYVDFGRSDGRYYLATEWLEGYDLAERLRQGPLTLAGAVQLAERLAGALSHLHELGIVHRDVKPSNVLLAFGNPAEARLVDLGIARRGGALLTLTGELLGTPAYMAPEQARGESDIDGRADLFSLGCLLFECLTGRPSFQGTNPVAVLAKILWEPAPRLAELVAGTGTELDELIGSLLAKDKNGRPRSAREAEQRLRRLRLDPSALPENPAPRARENDWPAAAPTAGRGLELENQLVSIVLLAPAALVREATAIGESPTAVSPSSHHALPNAAKVELLIAKAAPFGGEVQALANGAVVVTIRGAGVATDRATLAARCALALHQAAGSLATALATGRATLAGRLPVGDVIDRAARLLRAAGADPRSVRLDEATAGLLDARFELGGDEEGFFLREELPHRSGLRPMLGFPSPFVGREGEMALLRRLAEEVLLDREARALLILAPPGGGKSRLLAELAIFIEGHEQDSEIWLGRADPLAAAAPYGLLASALRHTAAIRDDEPPALRRSKLRARLRRHLDESTADRVALFLGELIGAGAAEDGDLAALRAARHDPQLMGDQLRRAWLDLFAAESREQPLFLLLEDLHWGDLASVQTVDAALLQLGRQAMGVLAAGRPETADRFPGLWASRPLATVPLRALGRRPAAALVRARLGQDADPAVVDRLVEHAAGNPFFLEELARARAEGGSEALPETVLAMVQVRFESLPAELRRVLRAASVFGQSFWRRGVAQVVAGGEAGGALAPPEAMEKLAALELIEKRLPSRFAAEEEYGFRHALFREAAYALLSPAGRLLGHRLAGQWLEKAGEQSPPVLAEHFDRGDRRQLAAPYFAAAAERDLEGGDVAAALGHALRGLEVVEAAATRGWLHLVAAEACRWSGRPQDTQQHAERALEDLAPNGRLFFRALGEGLVAASRRGDATVAGRLLERLLAAESRPEKRSAHLYCLALAARQVFHEGRAEDAEQLVSRAEALAREGGVEAWALAELERLRGARARHRGDLAGDLAGYSAALAAFEAIGDRRSAANTRVSLGFAYLEAGALERGEAELRAGLELAEELGLPGVKNRARQNLGLALYLRGETGPAINLLEQVAAASRQHDDKRFEGWSLIYLASARLAAGDPAGAAGDAGRARDLLAGSPPARAGALAVLARAKVRSEELGEAKAAAAEAMAVLHEQGGIEEFESLVRLAWIEVLEAQHDTAALLLAAWSAQKRIEARAAAIADPEMRRAFRQNLPENAALLAYAAGLPARA
jgi:eukaryotic-like serine/threonine-protein kinase